jgi:hypothetical protein
MDGDAPVIAASVRPYTRTPPLKDVATRNLRMHARKAEANRVEHHWQ